MVKVVCFGEALVDMLSNRVARGADPEAHAEAESFTKFAGGAPANAAVAVARLGGDAHFAGMLGDDMFGHFLLSELQSRGVATQHVQFTREANTGLAFISLDEQGERSFAFYRPPAADLLFDVEALDKRCFDGGGILHICSNSLTEPAIADATLQLVTTARARGWLVSFDVNLRHNLWADGHANRKRIQDLLVLADLVKFSLEELEYLADGQDNYLPSLLQANAQLVMITDGANSVQWVTRNDWGGIQPPAVRAVDTTAGGDAFIGAIIYQLAAVGLDPESLTAWLAGGNQLVAIEFACACGAYAVSRHGAFSALPTKANADALVEQYYETHE